MRCATYNEREEDRGLYFGIRYGMASGREDGDFRYVVV